MANKKNDKDDLFPGVDKKLTTDEKSQQTKSSTKQKNTFFDMNEHKRFLNNLGHIDEDIVVEELSPKEAILALDKTVASEFKISYAPWQEKIFDTLYTMVGVNVYKAGLEKKLKKIDGNISSLKKDVRSRQERVVGTVEFVPPNSIDDKVYARAQRKVREKDKGLQYRFDELQFGASQIKERYDLGEAQLTELRIQLHEIDESVAKIDIEKDLTAQEKISVYNKKKISIDADKRKLESMQNEYVANAKSYKAKMDGLTKQILIENNVIEHGRSGFVVASSKGDVLRMYIDDRTNSTPIPVTIKRLKTAARDSEYMDSAIAEYDNHLNQCIQEVQAVNGLFNDSFQTTEVEQELRSNLDRANADKAQFMADFTSQYGL